LEDLGNDSNGDPVDTDLAADGFVIDAPKKFGIFRPICGKYSDSHSGYPFITSWTATEKKMRLNPPALVAGFSLKHTGADCEGFEDSHGNLPAQNIYSRFFEGRSMENVQNYGERVYKLVDNLPVDGVFASTSWVTSSGVAKTLLVWASEFSDLTLKANLFDYVGVNQEKAIVFFHLDPTKPEPNQEERILHSNYSTGPDRSLARAPILSYYEAKTVNEVAGGSLSLVRDGSTTNYTAIGKTLMSEEMINQGMSYVMNKKSYCAQIWGNNKCPWDICYPNATIRYGIKIPETIDWTQARSEQQSDFGRAGVRTFEDVDAPEPAEIDLCNEIIGRIALAQDVDYWQSPNQVLELDTSYISANLPENACIFLSDTPEVEENFYGSKIDKYSLIYSACPATCDTKTKSIKYTV
jgi:hypothetical protein